MNFPFSEEYQWDGSKKVQKGKLFEALGTVWSVNFSGDFFHVKSIGGRFDAEVEVEISLKQTMLTSRKIKINCSSRGSMNQNGVNISDFYGSTGIKSKLSSFLLTGAFADGLLRINGEITFISGPNFNMGDEGNFGGSTVAAYRCNFWIMLQVSLITPASVI